jgi:hypothetical protein
MITIPIDPYWEKLVEHHKQLGIDEEFWAWLKKEYGAYQVYIVSNPTQVGEQKGCGLLFGDESEATLFALKWS